jgi:hypothetical protein
MKYIIVSIPYIILAIASLIIGSIFWLWRFKRKDFFSGTSLLDRKIGWVDRIEDLF